MPTGTRGPNLFDYATSELSQDAMICWLLRWAEPTYADVDGDLHELGKHFVQALFECCNGRANNGGWGTAPPPGRAETIEVVRQLAHIDVVAVINGSHALLIEDKTMTSEHGGQLERHKQALLEARPELSEERVYPIYFKLEEQSDLSGVERAGYAHFGRGDILAVLDACPSTNAILLDYRSHIRAKDVEIASWRMVPPKAWSYPAWTGFFTELQRRFRQRDSELGRQDCGWGYVVNPAGGFMGFWWGFRDVTEPVRHQAYLQLEEGTLCAKIVVNEDERRPELRWHWHLRIIEAGKEMGLTFERPVRFGRGTFMTVARFAGDYRIPGEHGIDVDATLALLQRAEGVVTAAAGG